MNYDQALKIAADHAPTLIVDPEVPGQHHICVRKAKGGDPFSIMLPDTSEDTEADTKALTDALDSAMVRLK